jgi:hypothetical protein
VSGAAASVRGRTVRAWNAFWFGRGNTFTLGLYRVLFAYCLWREVGTTQNRSVFAIEGGFHLPYVPFVGPVSAEAYDWLHLAQYPFVALLGIGWFARPAAGVLLALQGYVFFADQLNFRNHPYFFLIVLAALAVSPCDDALSVKRWLRRRRGVPEDPRAYLGSFEPLTGQRLIQVQLSIIYFYAALHKMNGYYLSGGVLSRLLSDDLFDNLSGKLIYVFLPGTTIDRLEQWVERPATFLVPAVLTVAVELLLAFALWSRRLRPWAFAAGFALHAGIALTMNITTFSLATLATYLLFLNPSTLPDWLARQFGDEPAGTGVPRAGAEAAS